MIEPATQKRPRRTAPHIKMRPMSNVVWWTEFTGELLVFVLTGPTRTWTEIEAWGKARQYTDVTIFNMVAFLDLSKRIEDISERGAIPLWGAPRPLEPCPACRAENETGQPVRDDCWHTCERRKKGKAA